MIDDETSGSSSKMRYINAVLDELPSLPLWHFSKCHRSLYTILVLTRPERTLESILLSAVCSFLLEWPARLGASRARVVELVRRYAAKHLIPKPRIVSSKEFTKQQSIHDATQFPSSKISPKEFIRFGSRVCCNKKKSMETAFTVDLYRPLHLADQSLLLLIAVEFDSHSRSKL